MTVRHYFGWQQYFRQLHASTAADDKPKTADPERMISILDRVFHG